MSIDQHCWSVCLSVPAGPVLYLENKNSATVDVATVLHNSNFRCQVGVPLFNALFLLIFENIVVIVYFQKLGSWPTFSSQTVWV